MNWRQVTLRILPMSMVAWARPFSLVLPGLISTFGLSLDEAGFTVTVLEIGGVSAMLILGWTIDRWGALRLISLALTLASIALIASAFSPTYEVLLLTFFLIGTGSAATACSVNALMAATGDRRAFYLGLTHALFGLSSIAAPVAAGIIIGTSGWQKYYALIGLIGLMFSVAFHVTTREARKTWMPPAPLVRSEGVVDVLKDIGPVCVGVSAVVGVQGVFNSWSYLDAVSRYQIGHASAALAPAYVWVGILVGRTIYTFLGREFQPKQLLIGSCVVAAFATHFVGLASEFWVAMCSLVVLGIGVGGAYQLGTAWAVELSPRRIGAASTFVMVSAAMGSGICTWVTGIVVESQGFEAIRWVVSVVLVVGMLSFSTRRV